DVTTAAKLDPSWQATAADVEQIRRAAQRAARLTRRLLTFGRRDVAHPQPMSLHQVIAANRSLLEQAIGDRVEFVTTVDSDTPPVLADPGQLEQVLVNLAHNAAEAMPDGGTLTLHAAVVG